MIDEKFEAQCEDYKRRIGERMGAVEMETAVQDNRISKLEECTDEIKKAVASMPLKIWAGMGAMLGIIEAFRRVS